MLGQLDEQAVETFYLSNAWQPNDLTDVQTALRNVMPNAKVFGVASQNAIVMRATPDELLLAQKLINDLDKARAEVVVDIAVLEVSKNWERNLGIAWPATASAAAKARATSTRNTALHPNARLTQAFSGPCKLNTAAAHSSILALPIGGNPPSSMTTDSGT